MRRSIRKDVLVTEWIIKGQNMSINEWVRNNMDKHKIKNKDLVRFGISSSSVHSLRYERRPHVPTLGRFCKAMEKLAGVDYTEFFSIALRLRG